MLSGLQFPLAIVTGLLVCLWVVPAIQAGSIPPASREHQEHQSAQTIYPAWSAPVVVADDGGAIAEVCLQYSARSDKELATVYDDLFRALPGDVRILVACTDRESARRFIDEWGTAATQGGRDVHVINVKHSLTVWARDRRIARQSAAGNPEASFVPTAHVSYDDQKRNDLLLQEFLWPLGLVPEVDFSAFHLEGGNLVSNRRHLFIGANLLTDNQHRFRERGTLVAEVARIFGKEPILVHAEDGSVPWCHTDMYITPLDDQTILVADPSDGAAILGNHTRLTLPGPEAKELEYNLILARSPLQQRFDDVAAQLEEEGYRVLRMPALMNVEKDWMVTYNNVLMERRGNERTVYVPQYNIPTLDQEAVANWEHLGFQVQPINVSNVSHLGGAVRCLVNVTRRRPLQQRPSQGALVTARRGAIQTYEIEGFNNNDLIPVSPRNDRTQTPLPPRPLSDSFGDEAIADELPAEYRRRETGRERGPGRE